MKEKEEIFRLVLDNEKYKICLGNALVCTETFNTSEEAWNYINNKSWELIINVQMCVSNAIYNNFINNQKNEENEKNS